MRKQTLIRFSFVAAVLTLMVPAAVSAQNWPDYRNDDYYRRNGDYGRNGRYDDRYLRDSIRRLDRLAGDFQRDVDRTLDRSRENGSRHEDHLNADTREFRHAVSDLRNSFDNGRACGGRGRSSLQQPAALFRMDLHSTRAKRNFSRVRLPWRQQRRGRLLP